MSALAVAHGAVNAGQGFPDFDPPAALQARVTEAMRDGWNQYAPMAGDPALREWLAEDLHRRTGVALDPASEVTVGAGASSLLFAATVALCRPGDEVILIDPAYDLYAPAVTLAGATAVRIPATAPDFALPLEALAGHLTPRTRLLFLNSPHNPTGRVVTAPELARLADLLAPTDTILLSDEVYGPLVFDDRPALSAFHEPRLAERTLAAVSLGKLLHCTGWKIGALLGPADLMAEVRKVHQFDVFSTGAPFQRAMATYLNSDDGRAHLAGLAALHAAGRDRLLAGLEGTPWAFRPAEGGFFQLLDATDFATGSDADLCRSWTVRHGLATIPLSSFLAAPDAAAPVLIRVCFAKRPETLDAIAARLRAIPLDP
jgi:methionine aminotransferase